MKFEENWREKIDWNIHTCQELFLDDQINVLDEIYDIVLQILYLHDINHQIRSLVALFDDEKMHREESNQPKIKKREKSWKFSYRIVDCHFSFFRSNTLPLSSFSSCF